MAIEWLGKQDDIEHNVNTEEVAIRNSEFETLAEAIIAAAGVNATHGLKRQKGDIQNAIRTLLEVDRIGFMENKFKLNKKKIMATVKCSARTYEQETKTIRNELEASRNITIDTLALEGISQREIALRTGVPQKTVSRILSESNTHNAQMTQSGSNTHSAQMGQGESNTHSAQMTQEDEQEPSVFNHITTATVAENPWAELEQESSDSTGPSKNSSDSSQVEPNDLGEQSPCTLKAGLTDDELCDLVLGLDGRQQDLLRNLLNNM
jgi:transposase